MQHSIKTHNAFNNDINLSKILSASWYTLSAKLWLSVAWPLLALTCTTSLGFSSSSSLLVFTLFPLPKLCNMYKPNQSSLNRQFTSQNRIVKILIDNYIFSLDPSFRNWGIGDYRTALWHLHCNSLLAFLEFMVLSRDEALSSWGLIILQVVVVVVAAAVDVVAAAILLNKTSRKVFNQASWKFRSFVVTKKIVTWKRQVALKMIQAWVVQNTKVIELVCMLV